MPLLGDPGHHEMVACLQSLSESFVKPRAIIVVSAHWEESKVKITAGKEPELIYDYYGFPAESYKIAYPSKGHPDLAMAASRAVAQVGLPVELDPVRGFDHGHFVPLSVMYPKADIPTIQVSLLKSLSPAEHIYLGNALSELAADGAMVIGSGFSFHNMSAFFEQPNAESDRLNVGFEEWLHQVMSDKELSETHRRRQLVHWSEAPGARFCHPREEHLMPLHVCYGVAQSAATECYRLNILGKQASAFVWGNQ